MSHVDEGALHAYLDGALDEYPAAEAVRIREHLDGCAECARRLEEERGVRSRAHGILALAAPQVEAPSFEELRAYVRRTRPAEGGAPSRALRMRWVASVVLALGTGWLLRGGIPGPAADAALEAPRSVVTGGERVGTEPRVAPDEAPVEVPATVVGAEDRVVAAAIERDAPEVDGAAAKLAEAGNASIEQPRLAPEREAQVARRSDFADAIGEVVAAEPGQPRLPEAASMIDAGDRVAAPPSVIALAGRSRTDGADASSTATDSAPPAAAAEEERTRPARPDVVVTSAMERSGGSALRASVPEDEDVPVPGSPSLTVPGYAVVSITNLGQGREWLGVQAVQRLENGSTFEVYHLEPEVERSVVPAPTDGVGEVGRLTEEGWIVLQGPLPEAELEALLARLLGEGDGPQG